MNHLDAFLGALQADAALVHRPENLRWLAGYTGEGCLFVSKGARVLLTDFRYLEQAKRQAPGWTLVQVSAERNYPALIRDQAEAAGARQIWVETDYLTHDAYVKLAEALPGAELAPMAGAPERLREIKDEREIASIRRAASIASEAFMNLLPRLRAGTVAVDREGSRAIPSWSSSTP